MLRNAVYLLYPTIKIFRSSETKILFFQPRYLILIFYKKLFSFYRENLIFLLLAELSMINGTLENITRERGVGCRATMSPAKITTCRISNKFLKNIFVSLATSPSLCNSVSTFNTQISNTSFRKTRYNTVEP